jgi:hypothetical protein
MNLAMKEIGYDIKKMPLGKLGSDTILKVLGNYINRHIRH